MIALLFTLAGAGSRLFIGAAELEKQLIFVIILLIRAITIVNTVILAALERMVNRDDEGPGLTE